jgi:hypothetical protein
MSLMHLMRDLGTRRPTALDSSFRTALEAWSENGTGGSRLRDDAMDQVHGP